MNQPTSPDGEHLPDFTPSKEAELDAILHDIYSEEAIKLKGEDIEGEIEEHLRLEELRQGTQQALDALEIYLPGEARNLRELSESIPLDKVFDVFGQIYSNPLLQQLSPEEVQLLHDLLDSKFELIYGTLSVAEGIASGDLHGTLSDLEYPDRIRPEFRTAFIDVASTLIPDPSDDANSIDVQFERLNQVERERQATKDFRAFRAEARPIIDSVFSEYCDPNDPAYQELRMQLIPHLHIGYDVAQGFYDLASPLGLDRETYATIIHQIQAKLTKEIEQDQ